MKRANSIQFIPVDKIYGAEDLAVEYFNWLPTLFAGLIHVTKKPQLSFVEIGLFSIPLLTLKRLPNLQGVHFSVIGGILSRKEGTFSFEMENCVLVTSLKDFWPRLPWPIYLITQYPLHDLVMFLYSQHLRTFK